MEKEEKKARSLHGILHRREDKEAGPEVATEADGFCDGKSEEEAPCARAEAAEKEALLSEIDRLRAQAAEREEAFLAEKAAWETERRLGRLEAILRAADLPGSLLPLVDHEDPGETEKRVALLREEIDRAVRKHLRASVSHGVPKGNTVRGLTREEVRALPLSELEKRMGR